MAEEALIKMIQEKFPDRSRPITLCSIASYGCAQEVILHAKLVQLGYRVNWVLVDPVYKSHAGQHTLQEFKEVLNLLNGGPGKSTVNVLSSVDEISAKTFDKIGVKPDAFIAIDLGNFGFNQNLNVFHHVLATMETAIESLPYPHIYLHADKKDLEDVPADAVLAKDSGRYARRPTVTISFIDPAKGIQRKQVLGASAWHFHNYDASYDSKGDITAHLSSEPALDLLAPEWISQARILRRKAADNCTPELLQQFEELVKCYKAHINTTEVEVNGGTFLHELSRWNKPVEFVGILAKQGIDFTIRDRLYGNTPLMWAIADQRTGMAIALLEHGPRCGAAARDYFNIKADNGVGHGNTVLHLLVGKGQEGDRNPNGGMAKIVVTLGANVNMQNQDGNTAFHLACLRRDLEMMEFLHRNGASTTVKNADGKTPGDMLAATHAQASAILDHTSPFTLDAALFAANEAPAKALYQKLTAAPSAEK